jgi:Na+-transporting NADH:ubiquinone oxidoreductase subunit NqrC
VDAVSGGTITSKGLEKMLHDCLNNYVTYFKSKRSPS